MCVLERERERERDVTDPDVPQEIAKGEGELSGQLQAVYIQQILSTIASSQTGLLTGLIKSSTIFQPTV